MESRRITAPIKNYIEWLIEVPWNKNSATKNDIKEAVIKSDNSLENL